MVHPAGRLATYRVGQRSATHHPGPTSVGCAPLTHLIKTCWMHHRDETWQFEGGGCPPGGRIYRKWEDRWGFQTSLLTPAWSRPRTPPSSSCGPTTWWLGATSTAPSPRTPR